MSMCKCVYQMSARALSSELGEIALKNSSLNFLEPIKASFSEFRNKYIIKIPFALWLSCSYQHDMLVSLFICFHKKSTCTVHLPNFSWLSEADRVIAWCHILRLKCFYLLGSLSFPHSPSHKVHCCIFFSFHYAEQFGSPQADYSHSKILSKTKMSSC